MSFVSFKGLRAADTPPDDGPDWETPSKALIACDGRSNGCLLEHRGDHIEYEVDAIGRALGDLGLDDAPEGLSVWEGTYQFTPCGEWDLDCDSEPVGEFRDLTPAEWDRLKAGEDLWPSKPDEGEEA